jgi:uncharacterized protein (TIGR03086 family)
LTSAAELFIRATDEFDSRVNKVRGDQWDSATPCTEWTVRDLVSHVTGEQLWVVPILAGKTTADVGDAFEGDVLGDDPLGAWTAAVASAQAAAAEPGVENRTVHLSYGDESAAEYLWQIFTDALIHTWDLATAIGADQRLPDDLVNECASWWQEHKAMFEAAGVVADAVPVAAGVDPQTALLASAGRDAAKLGT